MNLAAELVSYMLSTIGALLPIVNPFAAAPMVITMTAPMTEQDRRDQIRRGCMYMFCILAAFLVAGGLIMEFLGISIPGLRVAGGLVIAAVGFRMLFLPQPSTAYADSAPKPDISFTPLAIPSLAGPGSIAVVIGMSTTVQMGQHIVVGYVLVAIGIAITALISYIVLRAATRLDKILGATGMNAMARIMGFLLICIGIQFVINGVLGVVGTVT